MPIKKKVDKRLNALKGIKLTIKDLKSNKELPEARIAQFTRDDCTGWKAHNVSF